MKPSIVWALAFTCCMGGCAAKASRDDALQSRLGLQGRIEGRTYKAPDRAFKVDVHPQAQAWLDERRPRRPDDARVPGNRWIVDGRKVASDRSQVYFVTFWEAGEALDRWDGYDSHALEVRRLPAGAGAPDLLGAIESVAAERTSKYKDTFGARVSSERIARGDLESGGVRYVYAAYDYQIKAAVVPNTLSRTYQAYANVCAFQPRSDVLVVVTSEVVAAGRDINEKERRQRVARDGCDLAWLATLKIPKPDDSPDQ